MLYQFLLENRETILKKTEEKTIEIAGNRASSQHLREGLPVFFLQLLEVLRFESIEKLQKIDVRAMALGADHNDEPAIAKASAHPGDEALARAAGSNGRELLKLGYTLSHVVHTYGAICQSITELAMHQNAEISSKEFHNLNRCLDIAIAGAVTEYQAKEDSIKDNREVERLGFLAHELRNVLSSVTISLQMIRRGTVGSEGSTGKVLDRSLKRFEELIDRSLTEVRLRVDPKVDLMLVQLSQIIDPIVLTAQAEATKKNQSIEVQLDGNLMVRIDPQLMHSAISNLIQNAIKYSKHDSKIKVRGILEQDRVQIEVEDECGGLGPNSSDLFKPFEQKNDDRRGLGLGLTIAKRATELSLGTIEAINLPKRGCIFRISLPQSLARFSLGNRF